MLTISVKNFGPIAEGSVDLKPLTIFMGPNNTGKSYMATAVYALLRIFGQSLPSHDEDGLASVLDAELSRLFGPVSSLTRGQNRANTLKIGVERWEPSASVSYSLPPDSFSLRCEVAQTMPHWTAESLPSECYYLPACRSWVACAGKSSPLLPGTGADFSRHWRQLMAGQLRPAPATEAIGRVAEFLEGAILLGGVIEVQRPGSPAPRDGLALQLRHASAAVSELAPLILFLKYVVQPGDLLILEEPESHLHPAAQLQMARGIARLVNAGVRVLITTHSSDFKGQIDNLLSMSNVSRETAESQGLEPEDCLQPEQVSAYGFHIDPDQGGSVAYPLPVGSDVGIEDEEFLPIAEYLYDQAIQFQRNRLA